MRTTARQSWWRRAAVAAVASGSFVPVVAAATFAPPVNVSQNPGNSFVPVVAVPSALTPKLFWHDFTSSPNLLWCADGAGAAWGPAAECTMNVNRSWRPAAVVDSQGRVHLAWRDRAGAQDDILYARYDGVAWSAPENISQSGFRSSNPWVALGPSDNPHVLWEQDSDGAGTVAFYESYHDGAVWSAPADTGLPFDQAVFFDTIRVAGDGSGNMHAAWHDGPTSTTDVFYAMRPPGGPWGAPENISQSPPDLSVEPAIAVAADGRVHLVWIEQDAVTGLFFEVWFTSKPPSGPWSVPFDVSQQGDDAARPAIAVAPATGDVHIAWWVRGGNDVFHVGNPRDFPTNVSQSADPSEWADVAAGPGGGVYVAWAENLGSNVEVFAAAAEDRIELKMVDERSSDGVFLTWTADSPPYGVGRSLNRDVTVGWTELTPPAGIPGTDWTDPNVLFDGTLYFYGVEPR